MAREAVVRYILEGQLQAETPIHVGGLGSSVASDMPLARDGQGRLYIPGTSLAGALRAWSGGTGSNSHDRLWGFQGKATELQNTSQLLENNGQEVDPDQDPDPGNASHIVVDDGLILGSSNISETRDHVAICRRTGAAAAGLKFDREILPAGTKIQFRLVADCTRELEAAGEGTVGAIHAGLVAGTIPLGAAKSRGLGRVALQNGKCRKIRLDSPEGVLSLVTNPQGAGDTIKPPQATSTRHLREFFIHWKPESPVMVKDGRKGCGADILPLVTRSTQGGRLCFVLPGSSLKGSLRSHAEKIVRTVLGLKPEYADFQKTIQVPLVDYLFGTSRALDNQETLNPKPGLGALSVDDCMSVETISYQGWEALMLAEEDEIQSILENEIHGLKNKSALKLVHHVAIDRWTGGAADTALFSVLEPLAINWSQIRICLDSRRLPEYLLRPAIALLQILFRDLFAGQLAICFGTNRGLGTIKVQHIKISADSVSPGFNYLEFNPDLKNDWQDWIGKNRAAQTGE